MYRRMSHILLLCLACLSLIKLSVSNLLQDNIQQRFPIVFVFVVGKEVCDDGFPEYIKWTLEQAVLHQPDCDVILASNFAECPRINDIADTIKYLVKIDAYLVMSEKSKKFRAMSSKIFASDTPEVRKLRLISNPYSSPYLSPNPNPMTLYAFILLKYKIICFDIVFDTNTIYCYCSIFVILDYSS